MTKLPRNIRFYRQKITLLLAKMVGVLYIPLFLLNITYANSLFLGVMFSYFIFTQFAMSQVMILRSKNKMQFFLLYAARLFLYSCPIVISFLLKHYFNFVVVLISLFSFQVTYVIFEFLRSLRKVRKTNSSLK